MDITPIRLLVILNEDSSIRMELHEGIPNSLEEVIIKVKNACGLDGNIRLQCKDTDFGNMFVNLTTTAAIKDLTVLKVIQLDPDSTTVILYTVDPSVHLDLTVMTPQCLHIQRTQYCLAAVHQTR